MTKIILSALLALLLIGTSQATKNPFQRQQPESNQYTYKNGVNKNIKHHEQYQPHSFSVPQPQLQRELQLQKLKQRPIYPTKIYPSVQPQIPIHKQPQWQYLTGINCQCAIKIIKNQRPQLKIQLLKLGFPYTSDLRKDRVRIVVDQNDVVKNKPYIG